jgi:hypothetical protein
MDARWKEFLESKRAAKNSVDGGFVKHVGLNDVAKVINEEISTDRASLLCLLRDGRLMSVEAAKKDVWSCEVRVHPFEVERDAPAKAFKGSLDELWKRNVKAWRSRDMSITAKACKADCGFVYFVQVQNDDAYVKIGYSRDVIQRWNHGLITDSPYVHQILGSCVALPSHERLLHEVFKSVQIHREWFAPCDELLRVAEFLDGRSLTTYRSFKPIFDAWQTSKGR